jgi:hypothetical protein
VTAISFHVGLNRVSAAHYGSERPLKGAVADAEAMQAIAEARGFSSTLVLNEAATVSTVADAIRQAAARLGPGDTFFFSYAGHGAQLFDSSGGEPDSLDETTCLYDRMLLDDEIHGLFLGFLEGVRLLFITDSCHSASASREAMALPALEFDIPPEEVIPYPPENELSFRALTVEQSRPVYAQNADRYREAKALSSAYRNIELKCSLQHFAACQDNQLAADGVGNGYFTQQILHHWHDGGFEGTYEDFFRVIERAMPVRQRPNRKLSGEPVAAFVSGRPFST